MSENSELWAGKCVYIFGAGLAGISAAENLGNEIELLGFIDNDQSKRGSIQSGVPVHSPEILLSNQFDLVMIASEFFERIQLQLLSDFNVPAEKIYVLPARLIKPITLGQSEKLLGDTVEMLSIVTTHLNSQNLNYYVDAGTLLGIYRDKQLIPWDDDLDIAINADDVDEVNSALKESCKKLQSHFGCQWKVDLHFSTNEFGAVSKGSIRSFKVHAVNTDVKLPMMDIFIKYVDGDTMDYVLSSRGIRMPSRHLLKTVAAKFADMTIRIPSDVEDYLTAHYGDWRTPVKDWDLSMLQNGTVF